MQGAYRWAVSVGVAALLWLATSAHEVRADDVEAQGEGEATEADAAQDAPVRLADLTFPFFFGFGGVLVAFALGKLDAARREAQGG